MSWKRMIALCGLAGALVLKGGMDFPCGSGQSVYAGQNQAALFCPIESERLRRSAEQILADYNSKKNNPMPETSQPERKVQRRPPKKVSSSAEERKRKARQVLAQQAGEKRRHTQGRNDAINREREARRILAGGGHTRKGFARGGTRGNGPLIITVSKKSRR